MNNNPENNGVGSSNTDDILEILKKKKAEDAMGKDGTSDAPTRVSTDAVKKQPMPEKQPEKAPVKPTGTAPKAPSGEKNPVSSPSSASPSKKAPSSGTPVSKPVAKGTPTASEDKGVSLSDFDDTTLARKPIGKKKKRYVPGYVKVIIYLAAVITVSVVLSLFAIRVGNDIFAFVKPDRDVIVTIEKDATLSDVAKELHEKGVIEYPSIYKMYSRFRISKRSYLTGEFLEGQHTVSPAMNYDQLLAALSLNRNSKQVVRVTIPEGLSFYEIIDLFIENGVMTEDDRDSYIEAVNEYEYDYKFIDEMQKHQSVTEDRLYRLEGYLFPDTYDFYMGENPVSALDKLLSNFDRKFDESWYQRADELGYTVDEIIVLASMIEAEGNNPEDYAKISSVFHNRLKNSASYPYLDSDATVLYSYQGEKKQLEGGDTKSRIHPYNTYLNRGLPPGPICSPGYEAIYAALYPESTSYYYFLTMSNGETVYSRNLDEHNAAIARSNKLDN